MFCNFRCNSSETRTLLLIKKYSVEKYICFILIIKGMGLYVGNWGLRLKFYPTIESAADIVGITVNIVRPDATTVERVGYVLDVTNKILYYDTQAGDITVTGDYKFWLTLDWVNDTKHLDGEPYYREFKNPGEK